MFCGLLASMVSDGKSTVFRIIVSLYVTCCFCIATFSIFFYFQYILFSVVWLLCFGAWFSLSLSCLGLAEFPVSVNLRLSSNLRAFQSFLQTLFLLSSWNTNDLLILLHKSLIICSFICLFVLFFLYVSQIGKFLLLSFQVLLKPSSGKKLLKMSDVLFFSSKISFFL